MKPEIKTTEKIKSKKFFKIEILVDYDNLIKLTNNSKERYMSSFIFDILEKENVKVYEVDVIEAEVKEVPKHKELNMSSIVESTRKKGFRW